MTTPADMPSLFTEQPLPPWRRAVFKVGSSLLAADGGGLSPRFALGLAQFVSANLAAGRELVIVSSGAVAAGRAILPKAAEAGAPIAARQALAALGQAQLIALWQRFFERPVAQVLLTHDDLRNRRRYLNARATLGELLRLGALPVINENDTVSVDELKLGDNDNLAAIVAALVDADALFIATDIDGLYSADPRSNPLARPLDEVSELTAGCWRWPAAAAAAWAPAACAPSWKPPQKPVLPASKPICSTAAAAGGARACAGSPARHAHPPCTHAHRRPQILAAPRTGGTGRDPDRCRRRGGAGRQGRIAIAGRCGHCTRRLPARRHGGDPPARRRWRTLPGTRRQSVFGNGYPPHRRPPFA